MKRFIAVFTAKPGAFENYVKRFATEEQRRATDRRGLEAWQEWVRMHAASIVDMGAPVGATKRVTSEGMVDARNNIAGYTVVQAESREEAARMFINHPNFTIFPGDGVDIMECLPVPIQSDRAHG